MEALSYKIGPAQRKKLLAGLRTFQVGCIAAGVMWLMFAMQALPGKVGLISAVVVALLCAGLAFGQVSGRTVEEWIPAIYGFAMRGRKANRRSVASTPSRGDTGGQIAAGTPPPTLESVSILRVKIEGGRELGIIKDNREGTFSAIVETRGESFTLLDRQEQTHHLQQWASILSGFAREGTIINRIQWIERAVPEDSDAIREYLSENAKLQLSHPLMRSYVDLVEEAGPVTQQHQIFVVIQVSLKKAARHVKGVGGGDQGAISLLVREVQNLETLMSTSGVKVLGALGPRQVAHLIRTTFDSNDIPGLANRASGQPDLQGTHPRNAWPMATENRWGYFRADGSFHATFWIAEWPRVEVPGDFLAPLLLQTSCPRTVSVIMEPIAPSKAMREVEMAHTSFLADEELRSGAGYIATAKRDRELEQILRKEQELADGHGSFRFSAYITVSGSSEEDLDHNVTEVTQAAQMSRLDLRRMWGEQDLAFTCSLPLGRGLK